MKRLKQTSRAVAMIVALLLTGAAWADRNITVDGNRADWAGATTCYTVNASGGGITVNYACMENNNASGTGGYLFGVVGTVANWPTNQGIYVGFTLDLNKDCVLDDANDESYGFYFPGGGATIASRIDVYSGGNAKNYLRSYNPSDCGSGANGWSAVMSGNTVEFRMAYACLGLSYGNDYRLNSIGASAGGVIDGTPNGFYDGVADTLATVGTPPDVGIFTATGMLSKVNLYWNNPAITHRGVVVLRSSVATPNTAPTNGVTYALNQTLGNATVAYVDDNGSATSTLTDASLTNGTRYFYTTYNHHQCHTYAPGTTSTIFAEPTTRVSPSPAWCYSTGLSETFQPITDANSTAYSAGQLAAITANITAPGNTSTDGTELFRPASVGGPIQNRFPITALKPFASGKYIITGDQSGRITNMNAATGAIVWLANGGVAIGDAIQAQPVAQLYNATQTNAAFKTAHPNQDLIFFATRNVNDPGKTYSSTNKVVAVNSSDGSIAWTHAPGNLDIVSGGMMVDYQRNYLWVASRAGPGTYPTLRVLSTIDGSQQAALTTLGPIDNAVVRDYGDPNNPNDDQAYVVNNAGTVYGLDLVSLTVVWSASLSAMSSYPFPTGLGFIASIKGAGGSVARYSVNGTIVTQLWTTPIANPTGVRIDYKGQKIFVGSSDKKLHQLDVAAGTDQKQINMGTAVGMPTIDPIVNRVHVGLADGRLCAFQLPLP